ncbi:MAG: hypothetical protein MZV49_15160 [Rhodopseudomonas palustris]|nr:hypothetical protein [Rhodopseudomonas palustris]
MRMIRRASAQPGDHGRQASGRMFAERPDIAEQSPAPMPAAVRAARSDALIQRCCCWRATRRAARRITPGAERIAATAIRSCCGRDQRPRAAHLSDQR